MNTGRSLSTALFASTWSVPQVASGTLIMQGSLALVGSAGQPQMNSGTIASWASVGSAAPHTVTSRLLKQGKVPVPSSSLPSPQPHTNLGWPGTTALPVRPSPVVVLQYGSLAGCSMAPASAPLSASLRRVKLTQPRCE